MAIGLISSQLERRARLNVIDIVKLLPGTNCKRCAQLTCLAFAALIADDKASILACSDLFMADFQEKRQMLFTLLRAAGYTIPDAFD